MAVSYENMAASLKSIIVSHENIDLYYESLDTEEVQFVLISYT